MMWLFNMAVALAAVYLLWVIVAFDTWSRTMSISEDDDDGGAGSDSTPPQEATCAQKGP